jgi:hypothetical protein
LRVVSVEDIAEIPNQSSNKAISRELKLRLNEECNRAHRHWQASLIDSTEALHERILKLLLAAHHETQQRAARLMRSD